MRKQFKKVLSMVLSAAMVLTLGSTAGLQNAKAVEADENVADAADIVTGSTVALLGLSTSDWSTNIYDEATAEADPGSVMATVDCDGTYTVGYNCADTQAIADLNFIAVRLPGLDDQFEKVAGVTTSSSITFSDVELKFDGVTQDVAWGNGGDGDARIQFGGWQNLDEVFGDAEADTIEVTFKVTGTGWTKVPGPVEGNSEFHAYSFFQTNNWSYRNVWTNPKDSGLGQDFELPGHNYLDLINYSTPVTMENAEITEDGTYTVSIKDIDGAISGDVYNMLGISTDIPTTMDGVAFTDLSVKIDGNVVKTCDTAEGMLVAGSDYYTLEFTTTYGDHGIEADPDCDVIADNSIEMTFTVTGIDYSVDNSEVTALYQAKKAELSAGGGDNPTPTPDGGGDKNPTPSPDGGDKKPTPTPPGGGQGGQGGNSPSPSPAGGNGSETVVGAKVGASVTVGAFKLKVTKAATTKSAGKATVTGLSKSGKKAKSLNVKASMKKGAASYKVTAIGKKAFKGAKATKITLNKNIKTIPASAFASCKKLSKLKIDGKLKKVTKKAFKGCKKKIAVSGKNKKANVKLLKKSGYKKFK